MKPVKTKVEVLQADMDIIDAKAELVPALPKPRGRKPRKIETPPENTELRKGKFAVHCVADWSAVERKVINVLIWNAFDDLLTTRTHEISMPLLMVLIDWPASKNVTGLRQYLLNMSKTVVEWDAWNQFGTEFKGPAWSTTSMLPHAEITDGMVKYEFTEALAKKLHNPAMYAAINLKVNRVLEGKYSLTLYENIVSYSDLPHGSSGTKPLMEWRRVLNALTKTYDEYKHFKARVIDPSIQEINLKSNITVQLVEEKLGGRSVEEIGFIVVKKDAGRGPHPDDRGLSDDEIRLLDAYRVMRHDLRGTDTQILKIYRDHGHQAFIGVADYVNGKRLNGEIKKNPMGYLVGTLANGYEPPSAESKPKRQAKKTKKQALSESLTQEQRRDYMERYIAGEGASYASEFDRETCEPTSGRAARFFFTWLDKELTKDAASRQGSLLEA